jgi:hypothetical protein
MVRALEEVAGKEVAQLINWEFDAKVAKLVESWPGAFDVSRGVALGLTADPSYADAIRAYVEERSRA